VVVIPYYLAKNEINSLITVTNHNNTWGKAVKINFREGYSGHVVHTHNVYLDAGDVWAFGLVPGLSGVEGQFNEPTVKLFSGDNSCVPLLDRSGGEFDPTLMPGGLEQTVWLQEGFIEIIEMATLTHSLMFYVDHNADDTPENCDYFAQSWEPDGIWGSGPLGNPRNDLQPPLGEISAELTLIDVSNGAGYTIPSVTLSDFFAEDQWQHTPPGDASLSLDAADSVAWLKTAEGYESFQFSSGRDAVSGLFMANQYTGSFDQNPTVSGQAEMILTFPTKRLHMVDDGSDIEAPFQRYSQSCESRECFCVDLSMDAIDRSGSGLQRGCGHGSCPYGFEIPTACGSTFVTAIRPSPGSLAPPQITHSENFAVVRLNLLEGYIKGEFNRDFQLSATSLSSGEQVELLGLPVTGLMLQNYFNANAAPGLLAKYGAVQPLSFRTVIEESQP
jgi:hypothetical protein